ncbi:MAG: LuxR C-terminal-related transcriptional regulator [Acidimicrobiales bacterium]
MRSSRAALADFVGRAEELAVVRAAIDVGGCVVAGAAGVGKSRLAAEAVGHGPVIRVLATQSAAAVPYGAFAHLLPPGLQRTTDFTPAFIQMLRTEHPGATPVVVVDDAHLLDNASAALVLALSTTGAARPLVTVRTPEPVPDAIAALWKEQRLERVELQSLSPLEVGDLVRSELGDAVHPAAVSRIADLSVGNPFYVHELLHDARQTGALERRADGWRWREELLSYDRLSVLTQRHIQDVSDSARPALEFVAVVGRLPLFLLTELTSDDAVEELEREGLIFVAPGAAAEVTVAHPLYGEVVAAGLPRTTGMRVRRRAAAALRDAGADPLQIATLLLDAGAPEPALFVEASGIALRRGGVRFALRLAEAAGERIEAALAVAGALIALARFDEVEPVLAPYEEAASHAALEVSVDYLSRRRRALLHGSLPDNVRADLLERAQLWHTGLEWAALIANENGWTAFYAGRYAETLRCIEPFADDEVVSLGRRFYLWALRANVYGRLARFDDYVVEAEKAKSLAAAMKVPPSEVRIGLMLSAFLPMIRVGRHLSDVEASLLAARAEATATGDRGLQTAVSMLLGTLSLRRGHAAQGVAYFNETVDAFSEADALNNVLWAAICRAEALASCGDADRAQAQLDEIDRLAQAQPRTAWKHTVDIERARALADGAAGRTSAAAARLLAAVDAGHNNPAGEITALCEAVRFGADPRAVARRLRPLVAAAQDELAELFLAFADALAADDAATQLSLAQQLHGRGCDIYAAEAAARASRSFANAGRTASSREAASLARRFAAPCGPVFSWALQLLTDAPLLTSREREIVLLAARGLRNKEIAEELFVSIRTVESHLLKACQKLGVENRRSLADVIDH